MNLLVFAFAVINNCQAIDLGRFIKGRYMDVKNMADMTLRNDEIHSQEPQLDVSTDKIR